MKRKSLAITGSLPPPYHGSNVSFQRVLSSEIHDRFEVTHIDTSDHRDSSNIAHLDMTNVIVALKAVAGAAAAAVRVRPNGFYICVAQSSLAYLRDGLAIAATKLLSPRTEVIIHLRGSYFSEFYRRCNPAMRMFIDATMSCVDHGIVLGECLRPNFEKWLSSNQIHVVPNGTTVRLDVEEKLTAAIADRPLRLLFLSTLRASKGIFDVVTAVSKFKREVGDIELRYAGERNCDDPYDGQSGTASHAKLQALVQEPDVAAAFKDLGIATGRDKENALLWADILVLPTYYPMEGLPNAILEGMAAGCAVISTRHAAIPEVVVDGVTGVLVEKQQPGQLFDRLLRFHTDRQMLRTMMAASHERYLHHYTAHASNTKLLDTLAHCMT